MKQNRWLLTKEQFGPLYPYIEDENVTDIDWDGDSLWITSIINGTKKFEIEGINDEYVERLAQFVANSEGKNFNQVHQVLTAETNTLRITFGHQTLIPSGTCFSIRKSMPKLRFSATEIMENGYCDPEAIHLLVNCIKAKSNFAFCGEPGAGKTECAKFFSTFIDEADKVITIEDTLEWHYKTINKGKRGDEIKVSGPEDYTKAIKLALRLNAAWLMLSEARSKEVQYLIEGWSTGIHGMTTLHTGSVKDIPDRVLNMMDKNLSAERMENNVYSYLNVGVLIKRYEKENGTIVRSIDEIGLFRHTKNSNECVLVMENGKFDKQLVPEWFLDSLRKKGIKNPFISDLLMARLEEEKHGMIYGMNNIEHENFKETEQYTMDNVNIEEISKAIENIVA